MLRTVACVVLVGFVYFCTVLCSGCSVHACLVIIDNVSLPSRVLVSIQAVWLMPLLFGSSVIIETASYILVKIFVW